MKGLEIRQLSRRTHIEDLTFCQTKIEELGFGQGSFSKVIGYPQSTYWNSTVQSLSDSMSFKLHLITDTEYKPSVMQFNPDDIPF